MSEELVQCGECFETQRDMHTECIACGSEQLWGTVSVIEGENISELYIRWKNQGNLTGDAKEEFEMVDEIKSFLEYANTETPWQYSEEINDLREYLRRYSDKHEEWSGEKHELSEDLLRISNLRTFLILVPAAIIWVSSHS